MFLFLLHIFCVLSCLVWLVDTNIQAFLIWDIADWIESILDGYMTTVAVQWTTLFFYHFSDYSDTVNA
jgi:hypothetical protein